MQTAFGSLETLKAAVVAKAAEYRANLALSEPQLARARLEKFRALAAYACAHSPYYRDIAQARHIDVATCTPADFPVLEKATLIDRFDAISTDSRLTRAAIERFFQETTDSTDLLHDKYFVRQTSGSSGKRLYIAVTPDECAGSLAQLVRGKTDGTFGELGPSAFIGITADRVSSSATHFLHTAIHSESAHMALDVGNALADNVRRLNAFDPRRLSGYTSAVVELAREQMAGRLDIRPLSVSCGGETLHEDDERLIEQAFGVRPINVYATTELGIMGIGYGSEMTLLEDEMIVECRPDCIYATNLRQFALPLIRYRINDSLTCLRDRRAGPYRVISSRMGRSEAPMMFENDEGQRETINPLALVGLTLKFAGVSRYQFEITGPRSFAFHYRLTDEAAAGEKAAVRESARDVLADMLKQKAMSRVAFEMVETQRPIIDAGTGKAGLVVRRIASR